MDIGDFLNDKFNQLKQTLDPVGTTIQNVEQQVPQIAQNVGNAFTSFETPIANTINSGINNFRQEAGNGFNNFLQNPDNYIIPTINRMGVQSMGINNPTFQNQMTNVMGNLQQKISQPILDTINGQTPLMQNLHASQQAATSNYNPQEFSPVLGGVFDPTAQTPPLKEFLTPKSYLGGPAGQYLSNTAQEAFQGMMGSTPAISPSIGRISPKLFAINAAVSPAVSTVINTLSGRKTTLPDLVSTTISSLPFAMMRSVTEGGGFNPDLVDKFNEAYKDPEFRADIGAFAEKVENSSSPNQMNMGDLGNRIQSYANDLFGRKGSNLTNTQMKNVFDLLAQQSENPEKFTATNKYGLSTQNMREGENPDVAQPAPGETQTPVQEPVTNTKAINSPEGQLAVLGYKPEDVAQLSKEQMQEAVDKSIPPFMNDNLPSYAQSEAHPPKEYKSGPNVPPEKTETENLTQNTKEALAKHFSEQQSLDQRANITTQLISRGVKGEDETALFRNTIEHPENIEENAQKVQNPEDFKNAVKSFQDLTDYVYGRLKTYGSKMGYIEDYYSHLLDLSKPGEAERLDQFIKAKAANTKGYFNKGRVFENIDELEANGFTLKHPTIQGDISEYIGAAKRELAGRVLPQEIGKARPGEVYSTNFGEAPPASFRQLNVPGATGTYVSPTLNKELYGLNKTDFPTLVTQFDKFNRGIKEMRLAGGGFHALNTTFDYIGNELAHFRIPRIDEAVRVFFDSNYMNEYKEARLADGTIDKAGQMGVTLGKMSDFSPENVKSVVEGAQKYDPLSAMKRATFDRLINFYKLETVKNIDTTDMSPEEKLSTGKQVNNIFGGQNLLLQNRNAGIQKALHYFLLAPDYQEGRFTRTINAFSQGGPAGNLARTSLLGRLVVTAVVAEVGRRIVTGKWDQNVKDAVQNTLLAPNIPSPGQSAKGKNEIINLPKSNISDIAGIVGAGTVGGFLTPQGINEGIRHFAIGHLGSIASPAFQYVANENYYGQPLTDTFQGNQSLGTKIGNTVTNQLPIPVVQVLKVIQGKNTPLDAIINTVGLRVTSDPNNIGNVYYRNMAQVTNGFDPNELAAWNTLHPTKKDVDGSIVLTPGLTDSAQKAIIYLNTQKDAQGNPIGQTLQNSEVKLAQMTPGSHDPLWSLPQDQRNLYFASQVTLPGESNNYRSAIMKLPWFQTLMNDRTNYFNSIQQSQTTANNPANPGTPSSTGSGNVSPPDPNLYNTNRNLYFQQLHDYNNSKLIGMGLGPLTTNGNGMGTILGGGTSSHTRSSMMRSMRYQNNKFKQKYMRIKKITGAGKQTRAISLKMPKPKFGKVGQLKMTAGKAKKLNGLVYKTPKLNLHLGTGVGGKKRKLA